MVDVHYAHGEPYRRLGPGQPARPYLPVRVFGGQQWFDALCLVDSGADLTLFHADFAQLLGLDLQTGQAASVGGVGGATSARLFTLDVLVGGVRYQDLVAFSEQVPRAFGLLGGAGSSGVRGRLRRARRPTPARTCCRPRPNRADPVDDG